MILEDGRLYTLEEAAVIMHTTVEALRKRVSRRQIGSTRDGREIRLTKAHIDAYYAAREVLAEGETPSVPQAAPRPRRRSPAAQSTVVELLKPRPERRRRREAS